MKKLKFKYLKATNALCFGEDGIELHFQDYGNVILINGINLDNPGSADKPGSNGAGKSSLPELISIALYGRTIKNPTEFKGSDIVNELTDDRGKAVIEIEWDDFRVVRVIKKKGGNLLDLWHSKDHLWDDESLKSKGAGINATQKMIEEAVGMSHHTFCNVVIFDDKNSYSFLEADTPTKREIVENLLGLDKYREYSQNAKNLLKEKKSEILIKSKEYESSLDLIKHCDNRITKIVFQTEEWKNKKQKELSDLQKILLSKQEELSNSDNNDEILKYTSSREKIGDLNEKIGSQKESKAKAKIWLDKGRDKLAEIIRKRNDLDLKTKSLTSEAQELKRGMTNSLELVKKLEVLEGGAKCPTCYGTIDFENYSSVLIHERTSYETKFSELKKVTTQLEECRDISKDLKTSFDSLNEAIKTTELKVESLDKVISRELEEISELSSLSKPDISSFQLVLESKIAEIKNQIQTKQLEINDDPYKEILNLAKIEKSDSELKSKELKKELDVLENELPYFEFWVKAFGDKGIRKLIVDGIIPSLNSKINYWMQYLIDNCMELVFNNEFQSSITRNGTPTKYTKLSAGEARRSNLAISQAFAHIMMLNTGFCPSIVFLDEITGGSIDHAGVIGIYNMIFELAKERQVFVTTHDKYLLDMLEGCESINLKKENDITVLV